MARKKWRQNRNYAHVHFRIQSDTKPFEYAACGRENFRIRKKIFAEKKFPDTCGHGLKFSTAFQVSACKIVHSDCNSNDTSNERKLSFWVIHHWKFVRYSFLDFRSRAHFDSLFSLGNRKIVNFIPNVRTLNIPYLLFRFHPRFWGPMSHMESQSIEQSTCSLFCNGLIVK